MPTYELRDKNGKLVDSWVQGRAVRIENIGSFPRNWDWNVWASENGYTLVTVADPAPEPILPTPEKVKIEAMRRIIDYIPEWKQRNLTARGLELTRKQLAGGTLTSKEASEIAEGEVVWGRIKLIRETSDVLELTLPMDFQDDKHWP